MSYSNTVIIYDHEGWVLESHGNGAAYTLRRKVIDGRTESVFLQGDDADIFREQVMDGDGWLIEGYVCGVPCLHLVFEEYINVMSNDGGHGCA